MQCAVAVFVKTPGLSPLKTRLGQNVGQQAAERFYELSAKATEEVISTTVLRLKKSGSAELEMFWAVAEKEGLDHSFWQGRKTIMQGEGGLGDRLAHVYSSLLQSHEAVIFLGADAPQVTSAILEEVSVTCTRSSGYVVGPAVDGGFYLFGCSQPIAAEIWKEIAYSTADTLRALKEALLPLECTDTFSALQDVDTLDDFKAVQQTLEKNAAELLPRQLKLLHFMTEILENQGSSPSR